MKLSREEYLETVKGLIGEDLNDNSLTIIENLTDTYDELISENRAEEWKKKYEENDEKWRKKYYEKFFSPNDDIDESYEGYDNTKEKNKKLTFESLFSK